MKTMSDYTAILIAIFTAENRHDDKPDGRNALRSKRNA
jgi:hypothetical protein